MFFIVSFSHTHTFRRFQTIKAISFSSCFLKCTVTVVLWQSYWLAFCFWESRSVYPEGMTESIFFSFSFFLFCSRERWGSLCSEDDHLLLTKGATIKSIHLEQPCALLFHTTRSNQGCTDKRWLRGCQSVSGLAHRDRHSTLSVNVE